ncbi:MAG: RidA family protein [Rhizobiaceae bacterium]
MPKRLNPKTLAPPLARYSHGTVVETGQRLVFTSGQLAIGADGAVPKGCAAQAELCFQAIGKILIEADMSMADIVRINAFVTDRSHMADYMQVRDRQFPGEPPASTLVIVSGFTRPEFVVEIEAIAAK